ncbi:MAG: chemotaxis protein CheW [bacterium]
MKNNKTIQKFGNRLKSYKDQSEIEGRNFVFFLLTSEKYAVRIDSVQEIIKPKEITEIPHTPAYLRGVVNLRGKIVPVIDLRLRFGLPGCELAKAARIVVVRRQDQVLGLLVDAVLAVQPIPDSKIEPVPDILSGPVSSNFFEGIANLDNVMVAIIDLAKTLQKTHKDHNRQKQTEGLMKIGNES